MEHHRRTLLRICVRFTFSLNLIHDVYHLDWDNLYILWNHLRLLIRERTTNHRVRWFMTLFAPLDLILHDPRTKSKDQFLRSHLRLRQKLASLNCFRLCLTRNNREWCFLILKFVQLPYRFLFHDYEELNLLLSHEVSFLELFSR